MLDMHTDPTHDATHRRLWAVAGSLLIGYIALSFAGVALQPTLMLGDGPGKVADAYVTSSMTKAFAGGYVELVATLLFLVGALLVARLLRGPGDLGEWLSSCITAGATVFVASTIAVGFPAGAAALYDGHHGAPIATVTAVNDIRNFAFFLSGGAQAVFVLGVAAAVWTTARLPRWVAYSGVVVGLLDVATIPAARSGLINVATLLGFVWILAVGVTALRASGRSTSAAGQPVAALA
jgi:hypothetical protein